MLVLCVGMYRACSTWQYGVVGELLERHRDGQRLGFADGGAFATAVEPALDPKRWSVLKAHDAHERFAERLGRGQALGIYSHRDLRDVAFSWMRKTGQTFDELIERGFLDQCLRNDRFWRDRPGMLFQSYEALIAEPARGVAEIARHLGIGLESGEDRAIADLLSFEANRKRTLDLTERLQAEGVSLSSKDLGKYDRETLLHWNHIRDGRAGYWKELASPDQRATLARICGPWLVEHGYAVDPDQAGPALVEPFRETRDRVSYAQNMEDVLLDRMFRGRKGTYIDVGANHPSSINSTYYFYVRGWRGVNIEPVQSAFELFAEKRPEDINLQVAVSDVEGEFPFYEVADCNGLSSLSFDLAEAQRVKGFQVVKRVVPTRTVSGLIDQHGLFPPDIFSIDVEGNEEKVLRGIPLATWRPKVFVIEATKPMTNTLCHESWEPILLEQGYLFAYFDGLNRFYLRGDLANSLRHFECPVNPLDFYVKAETVEERERADALGGLLDAERRRGDEALAGLAAEQVDMAVLKARFSFELESRHRDYLGWLDEREGWRVERESWQAERESWEVERRSAQADRERSQAEREAWQAEREARQAEREARQAEREARQVEREASQADREAWQAEREAAQADRRLLQAGLDELADRVEGLERQRDALAREVEALLGERARLEGEVHARDVEIDRTRTQLGPYLKIDRLGVITAIQRRVHAHRAHADLVHVVEVAAPPPVGNPAPTGRSRKIELAPRIKADEMG